MKNLKSLMLVLVIALTLVSLVGCGGGEKEEAAITSKPEEKPTPAATSTPTHPPATEAGWKTCRVGETCSISIPEDWGGDVEAQVWWPGTADLSLGRPDVSVLCGGTSFMQGESFEDRVQKFIGTKPISKEKVNVSGLSGFKCVWESGGRTIHKHMGVFLEETIGGGMGMMSFADCKAPISVYDDYAATFDKIVNSFRGKD